jgi:hypothetical protein
VEPAPLDPPRAPIEGDSHARLLEPLEACAGGLGYTVCYRQLGHVEGLCDRRTRRISVAERLSANGRVAVLAHELAHALVGREAGLAKQLEELVVEAVAYVVCAGAGLDTGPDSVPYIAGWAGDDALKQLERTAELIDSLARCIEEAINPAEAPDRVLVLGGSWYLRQLADQTGTTFTPPATRRQASAEIARLKRRPRSARFERRDDRRTVDRAVGEQQPASSVRDEGDHGNSRLMSPRAEMHRAAASVRAPRGP